MISLGMFEAGLGPGLGLGLRLGMYEALKSYEGVVSPQGESPPKGGVATLPTTFSGVACCGSCPRSLRDLRVGL